MSTTTAPVPAHKLNKFETLMDHIGSDLEKFNNALINEADAEAPVIEPLLPANLAQGLAEFLVAATKQLASTDAQLSTIAGSTSPWAAKAAEATAAGSMGLIAILAKFGLVVTTSELPSILASVGTIASTLKLTGITAAPVVAPAPAPAGATVANVVI
jgi:hypothetical protein